ncbi:MAG: DUF1553 domain-containing protein [Cytophagales bacterium]|nr:MAG: DUF1553 domain-containing protein [Cytophagales bacterium]
MKFFKKSNTIFLLILALIICISIYYTGTHNNSIDFNTQVRPILNAKCVSCHGGVKKAGGISFIFRDEALGKGKSGKWCIVPGKAHESEFFTRLTHHDNEFRMPLGKEQLSVKDIDILKQWINEGAKWDKHWAFIPPVKSEIPQATSSSKNFIDNFILAQAEKDDINLKPNVEADKATLIRRIALDITGIPPTTIELEQFINDKSVNAYEKLIDNYLSSPKYGEKWAGIWLDMARYADSKGYEKDQTRNIWRYRDYLIKAFNQDKKFTDFTIEQLAGDLIPKATEDQILASAFHRNTLNNDEGGADNEEFRVAAVIDRTNTTFDVWQGITMGCTQCHGHPYDPIRHEEYYQFFDYFNQTTDADNVDETPVYFSPLDYDFEKAQAIAKEINLITNKSKQTVINNAKEFRRLYGDFLKAIDCDEHKDVLIDNKKVIPLKDGAYISFKNANLDSYSKVYSAYSMSNNMGCIIEIRTNSPQGPLIAMFDTETTFDEIYFREGKVVQSITGKKDIYIVFKKNKNGHLKGLFYSFHFNNSNKKKAPILDSLHQELMKAIDPVGTPVMGEFLPSERRTTRVFLRGSIQTPGDTVHPNVPHILNSEIKTTPKNRLEMAQWITHRNNPLTARVAVNRFWEQIFGVGIVETLEDFGSQGAKPSHPELLDYLAVYFMEDCNWSMKKIIKTILMSSTYRQSSVVSKEALNIDPKNKYLLRGARFRLSSEQIRDQALSVAGILSPKMFGPSVMPYQPDGIWQTVYNGNNWITSKGEDKYRRALYTYIKRSSPYPAYLNFDSPSREFCLVRRIRTNTPLQSLNILNDTVYVEASIALARKALEHYPNSIDKAIENIYYEALLKKPSQNKANILNNLYKKSFDQYTQKQHLLVELKKIEPEDYKSQQLAALSNVASAIINLDEFITKE